MRLSTLEKDQKLSIQNGWLPILLRYTLQKIETQEYNIDHLFEIILALGFLETVHTRCLTRLRGYKLRKRSLHNIRDSKSERYRLLKDQQLSSKGVSNDAYQNKLQIAQELHAEKPLSIRDQYFEKALDAEHNDSQNQQALRIQNTGRGPQKHFSGKNLQLLQEQWRQGQVLFSVQKDLEILSENLAIVGSLKALRWKDPSFLFPLSLMEALSTYHRGYVIFSYRSSKISQRKTYLQILIGNGCP